MVNNDTVQGIEFNVKQNEINLEDSLIGLIDHEHEITYIDSVRADITYAKTN
jgi:hypothetical protein